MIYLLIIFLAISILIGNAAISLLLGILFSSLNKKDQILIPEKIGSKFLKIGIIFLGGSISYASLTNVSIDYFPLISLYVISVMILGFFLGRLLKVEKKHLLLLISGTAICGGTAMAALAPIIKSKKEELASSITIVFLLNLFAIIAFPFIGEAIGLSQLQFGIFAALAIHDTASVVGAASIFGDQALEIATIMKLGRTLWIVPLVLVSSWYFNRREESLGFPYFILLFVFFVIAGTYFIFEDSWIFFFKNVSMIFLSLGLFFIGTEVSLNAINQMSLKPVGFAVLLWSLVIGVISLFYFF
ncbi:MAG: putative sulfate exporter family transporter [Gammaproteobacteria bacterium]|nr:putative sulfate exporter family transporter [Gammaproteobacteria bacterium]|tara:strand:- start:269 stop:1171 length:903 start_codon:yes stop_codon:yes gene_type:complete